MNSMMSCDSKIKVLVYVIIIKIDLTYLTILVPTLKIRPFKPNFNDGNTSPSIDPLEILADSLSLRPAGVHIAEYIVVSCTGK